jgi:hypothetical protein
VPEQLINRISAPTLSGLDRDENHEFLIYSNVLIVVWSGRQMPEVCEALYDAAIALARQTREGKLSVLSLILPSATPPSPEAREALGRLVQDPNQIVYRSALVYPYDGFLASIIRSIALTLMQRSTRRRGHQVFQHIDKAIEWVTEGLPTNTGGRLVCSDLVRQLESRLAPARTKLA